MSYIWLFVSIISVATCYELGGVISGNRMSGVPLGISLGDGELDIGGVCTRAGVACQNCTHAVTCIALPVGWLTVPLAACSEDQSCNAREGGCTAKPVPECQETSQAYEHKCEQIGIFPDAYDCRKFHLCSPPEDAPAGRPADHRVAMCPRHYAYNPYTAQCSIKLAYGQCEDNPVPACTKVGQTDTLPNSPNHYYVCLSRKGELYPQVFICPHGLYFWGGYCRTDPQSNEGDIEKIDIKRRRTIDNDGIKDHAGEGTEINKATTIGTSTAAVRITEYPPDTFLADKFDLTNYETIDDLPYVPHASYEFSSSSIESF